MEFVKWHYETTQHKPFGSVINVALSNYTTTMLRCVICEAFSQRIYAIHLFVNFTSSKEVVISTKLYK